MKKIFIPDPFISDIAYDYKPDPNRPPRAPIELLVDGVYGNVRREMIRAFWQTGHIYDLPPIFFGESLPIELSGALENKVPIFAEGEGLRHLELDQREIARISRPGIGVISIRFTYYEANRFVYSAVGDFGVPDYDLKRRATRGTLMSLGELIQEIQTISPPLADAEQELARAGEKLAALEKIAPITRVSSFWYPELEKYYRALMNLWWDQTKEKIEEQQQEVRESLIA